MITLLTAYYCISDILLCMLIVLSHMMVLASGRVVLVMILMHLGSYQHLWYSITVLLPKTILLECVEMCMHAFMCVCACVCVYVGRKSGIAVVQC